ncbi:MAG: hypothetical protein ACYDA8_23890, partial [Deferrisomatales bacterium]
MIEPMVRLAMAVPGPQAGALAAWLYARGQVHLTACAEPVTRPPWAPDPRLLALEELAAFCGRFRAGRPGFLASLFPLRTVATAAEVAAAAGLDAPALAAEARRLEAELAEAAAGVRALRARAAELAGLAPLGVAPSRLRGRFLRVGLVAADRRRAAALDRAVGAVPGCSWQALTGAPARAAVAYRPGAEGDLRAALAAEGLALEELPDLAQAPARAAAELHARADAEEALAEGLRARCRALAGRAREVELARAAAEAALLRDQDAQLLGRGRVCTACGYLRRDDLAEFAAALRARFPAAALEAEPPAPGDPV